LRALGAAIADHESEFGVVGSSELATQSRADRAHARVIRGRPGPSRRRTRSGRSTGVWSSTLARSSRSIEMTGRDVRPLDAALGRHAGVLPGRARRSDVLDAAVVLLAEDADEIVTSDVGDLAPLARHLGRHVEIVPV
jgi:hypothetical protein